MNLLKIILFFVFSCSCLAAQSRGHKLGFQYNTNYLGNTFGLHATMPVGESTDLLFGYETGAFRMARENADFPFTLSRRGTKAVIDIDLNHVFNITLLFHLKENPKITWFSFFGLGLATFNFNFKHEYQDGSNGRVIGEKRFITYGGLFILDIFQYRSSEKVRLNAGFKLYG